MNCNFCGGITRKSKINQAYKQCTLCNTHFMFPEINYNYHEYFEDAIVRYTKILNADRGHYDRMVKTIIGVDNKPFKSPFNKIWAFGGGFPKLETYFNATVIDSFDMMAKKYEKISYLFDERFKKETIKVNYISMEITPEKIAELPIKSNDLVTFVHFLEHFNQAEIIQYLKTVSKLSTNLLIYQPNVTVAKSSNWVHFNDQHKTLMDARSLSMWLDSNGYIVMNVYQYSDDMFIFCKT
jgi:hypothetical protein